MNKIPYISVASIKSVCCDKLLPSWLTYYHGNILDFLSGLDPMSSNDVCEKAVKVFLREPSADELLNGFDILDDR